MTEPYDLAGALDYLAEAWPMLIELKTPGTRRRWQDQRRAVAAAAPELIPSPVPGTAPAPAPVVVSMLDLTHRVAAAAAELEATLVELLDPDPVPPFAPVYWPRLGVRSSAYADPRPHLAFVARYLTTAQVADARTVPWVLGVVRPIRDAVEQALGEQRAGQELAAICPWCLGRTPAHPTGGARTVQVLVPTDDDDDREPLIVCTGLNCTPPESACGSRDERGRPAWREREWDWLARQLLPAP